MSLDQKHFGTMPDGAEVPLYILQNERGMKLEVIPYGCRIVRLWAPDRTGAAGDLVLGHDTLEGYMTPGDYLGTAVGRCANRIGGAAFRMDGKTYPLSKNDGENTLHGGPGGYSGRLFRVKCSDNSAEAPSITFVCHDSDGTEGYPGNVEVTVKYTLSTDNALIIDYTAVADAKTPINLTNHSYFNLSGDPAQSILNYEMQINADSYTAVDDALIPTGELIPVAGTPYDFTKAKTIGQDIGANDPLLKRCGGYDHNFALRGEGMRKIAEVYDQRSGRAMLIFTDLPGVQFYTANDFAPQDFGKNGAPHQRNHAFCMETQFYPDSPNQPQFPSCFLTTGEPFKTTTIYKFEVR